MPALFPGLTQIGAVLGPLEANGTLHIGIVDRYVEAVRGGSILREGEGC